MPPFKPNRGFRRDYDRLYRKDPLAANTFLLLCELADFSGQVETDPDEMAIGNIFRGDTIIPPNELPEDIRRAISSVKIHKRIIGNGENCVIEQTFEYRLWDKGRALERIRNYGLI